MASRCFAALLVSAFVVVAGPAARAAEATRVVSAGDADDAYDFNLTLDWWHEQKSARVVREAPGLSGGETTPDLAYRQVRNVLGVRADFGLLPDVGLFLSVPVVVADDRQLSFAQGVNAASSSVLRDRILPGGGTSAYGIDADQGRPFESPSDVVFRGPTRRGVAYVGAGLNWAALNQARDPDVPTWLIRFEARFDVSGQRFDPANPAGNRSVGVGYHQMLWSMLFSRRFGPIEPYVGGWYMLPVAYGSSPFKSAGFASGVFGRPQHRAGGEAGLEATVWQRPALGQRIALEMRGRAELRLMGLAQSELWEPLSGSAACARDAAACRAGVDRDVDGDGKLDAHPGVTRSPSYGIFGGDVGLTAQAGPHVRFRGLFGMSWEQARFLTDGRSGNAVYDVPGRRFGIQDSRTWHVLLDAALLF